MLRPRWLSRVTPAVLLLLALPAASVEVRRVEVLGAVAVAPEASEAAMRDAALEAALAEAVDRVARGLLAEGGHPPDPEADLRGTLGDEPISYTVRYRILEDRGKRRALLVETPGVDSEYVLLVAVHVAVDRVRQRLADAGLLIAREYAGPSAHFRVELLDLPSYGAYEGVRDQLVSRGGAREVTPLEFSPGRAVLRVRADGGPSRLLDVLRAQGLTGGLSVEAAGGDPETLRLRVYEAAVPLAMPPGD